RILQGARTSSAMSGAFITTVTSKLQTLGLVEKTQDHTDRSRCCWAHGAGCPLPPRRAHSSAPIRMQRAAVSLESICLETLISSLYPASQQLLRGLPSQPEVTSQYPTL